MTLPFAGQGARPRYTALVDATVILNFVVRSFELIGVLVMVVGLVLAAVAAGIGFTKNHNGTAALRTLRTVLGGSILLGLEVLVAADLVTTVTSHLALEDVLALGLIVVIRTVLSFTIQIEIDGSLPWRRALTQSGGAVIARGLAESPAAEH